MLAEDGYAEGALAVGRLKLGGESTALGLFAREERAAGECIVDYSGTLYTECEGDYITYYPARVPRAMIKFGSSRIQIPAMMLSAEQGGSLGRLINHSYQPNAAFKKVILDGMVQMLVVANRAIQPGEQILIDYGRGYWVKRAQEPIEL